MPRAQEVGSGLRFESSLTIQPDGADGLLFDVRAREGRALLTLREEDLRALWNAIGAWLAKKEHDREQSR